MTSISAADDSLLPLAFSLHANPGAYAALLGAGVSAASGIPTAWGVLQDLTARVADVSGEDPGGDSIRWYEDRFGEEARYETLLEKLAPTPLARQNLLRDYFERSDDDKDTDRKLPTAAHVAIARLVSAGTIRVIVTLNFDRLMEQALRSEGVEPTVVASPADVHGLAPLHTLNCCVIHLHGDYLNPTSMLNTTTELGTYDPATLHLLTRVLEDYGLIVAGWSSTYDPALRAAIAEHYSGRLALAWIEPFTPSPEAVELRTLRGGLLLETDADRGFGAIADAVDALATRSARHPLTVPVAVDTAKRELSGRRVAIHVHDMLNREFIRLHDHPDFNLPNHQDDLPFGGYAAMLARTEEVSRVAGALIATLAYWGDAATDQWWLAELERFAAQPRDGGMVKLLQLRRVTGSVLFYAAGVSAIACRRFELLSELLKLQHTAAFSNRSEPLFTLLDADLTYMETPGGSARLLGVVRPLLREALTITEAAIDDAWQLFEVLRLARSTLDHRSFPGRAVTLNEKEAELRDTQQAFDTGEAKGGDTASAQNQRADAWQQRDRALGAIANLVPIQRPHVLAVDDGPDDRYHNPLAKRLAYDLDVDAANHPLITSNFAPDSRELSIAVSAVSVAIGRVGNELAWNRLPPGGGAVVQEVWLDTNKTPNEVSGQA